MIWMMTVMTRVMRVMIWAMRVMTRVMGVMIWTMRVMTRVHRPHHPGHDPIDRNARRIVRDPERSKASSSPSHSTLVDLSGRNEGW